MNIFSVLNSLFPDYKFSMWKVHATAGKPDYSCHYQEKLLILMVERIHTLEGIKKKQTLSDFYKLNKVRM